MKNAKKSAAQAAAIVAGTNLNNTAVGRALRWLLLFSVRAVLRYDMYLESRARIAKALVEFREELSRRGAGDAGLSIVGVHTQPSAQSMEPDPPPTHEPDGTRKRGFLERLKGAVGPTVKAYLKGGAGGAAVTGALSFLIGATFAAPPLDMALVAEHYHNVPAQMTRAVIQVESSGRPYAVSESNARGLMQMKRLAMIDAGCGHLQERVHDPIVNVWCGTKYLSQQKKRFGSWRRALAAYNRGPTYFAREGFDAMAFEYIRRVQAAGGVL